MLEKTQNLPGGGDEEEQSVNSLLKRSFSNHNGSHPLTISIIRWNRGGDDDEEGDRR